MAWVIIELSDAHNWSSHFAGGAIIPERRRPAVLQASRDAAEREAQRLADMRPDGKFVVFEAVAAGYTVKVPTHTTLAGKVFREASKAVLVQLGPEPAEELDDDLPF
jgi:hypothetical protein